MPMRNASAKGGIKCNTLQFNLHFQTNDVLFNPENPVNPDSKRQFIGPNCKLTAHLQKTCSFLKILIQNLVYYTPPTKETPTFAGTISGTEGD